MGAADFFLELPEKPDVDRNPAFPGISDAEERRDGRTLVVGRAAAEVAVLSPGEPKGGRLPVVPFRGLHVQVVVESDGGIALAAVEAAVDDGVALRLVDLGLAPARLNQTSGVFRSPAHLALAIRLDGNRGDLDDLGENALELGAVGLGELLEILAGESVVHRRFPFRGARSDSVFRAQRGEILLPFPDRKSVGNARCAALFSSARPPS